jgi:hypothetical protein
MAALNTLSDENIALVNHQANQGFGGQATSELTASTRASEIAAIHSLAHLDVNRGCDVGAVPFNQQPSGRSI